MMKWRSLGIDMTHEKDCQLFKNYSSEDYCQAKPGQEARRWQPRANYLKTKFDLAKLKQGLTTTNSLTTFHTPCDLHHQHHHILSGHLCNFLNITSYHQYWTFNKVGNHWRTIVGLSKEYPKDYSGTIKGLLRDY